MTIPLGETLLPAGEQIMGPTESFSNIRAKILIAEDSPTQAERLRHLLEGRGHVVKVAANGKEALAALHQQLSSIVITDIVMPEMDGYTLCREIKAHEGLKDIPVILLTSLSGPEEVLKALQCGADNFVRKPYDEENLLSRIDHILTNRELRKREKTRLGLEIDLGGQRHFITSDRQQILDLLLSTYVEAVQLNRDLAVKHAELTQLSQQLERKVEERTAALVAENSERKKAEEKFRGVMEAAPEGILGVDREGRILLLNEQAEKMFGYARQELIGQPIETLVPEPLRERHRTHRASYQSDPRMRPMGLGLDLHGRRKDGSEFPMEISLSPLQTDEGLCVVAIIRDITERQALEKRLRQAEKFEAIGQLAGGIAHDFNNVIAVMMGWAEVGMAQVDPENRVYQQFQKIRDQAGRAAGLTRQLLAFARRQILEPQNLSVNQVITQVLSLLEQVIGAHIELKTVLAPKLEVMRADPTQLEQVLINLCANARDAMPRGGQLVIETKNVEFDEDYCRLHPYARPGRYVMLSVSDSGEGIDAAKLEHVFEPFFTTKEVGKGTGLGLATVYGIVKQHNGFIHVYSEPGNGTAFRAYFPVVAAAAEKVEKHEDQPVRGGAETILLAEDNEGLRELACEALKSLGYRVFAATDGEEAVQVFLAQRDQIALVLLDVVMPKCNGPDAYARIRAAKPDVPVVFTTGYSAESDLLNSTLKKGDTILQKPYGLSALGRKVREALDSIQRK
ncbi:MAG: response regulator [Acidobacteria bacterium]|nr:response regulator [Acidobacteriota bacterium]